jgi:N-acyl homoserine lactone hydrolase
MEYRIIPLNLGEAELESKSKFTYFKDFAVKIQYPYIAWIIEGNGVKILVDSGIGSPEWVAEHRNGRRIKAGPLGDFASTLRFYGVDPDEIGMVICTHLHYDHCCNHHLLPNATFLVQQKELAHAMAPIPTQRDIYGWWQNAIPPFLSVAGKYRAIKGDREIAPGISVLLTPGHSPGHQAVLVRTASGNILLAGDSIPLFENWQTRTPSGIHVNLEDYQDTFEKIEALKDVFILPGHDLRVFEKAQYP